MDLKAKDDFHDPSTCQNLVKGNAKFAASVHDAKSGKLIVSTDPAYGFSKEDDGVVLFLFNRDHNDMAVDFDKNPPQVQSRKQAPRDDVRATLAQRAYDARPIAPVLVPDIA